MQQLITSLEMQLASHVIAREQNDALFLVRTDTDSLVFAQLGSLKTPLIWKNLNPKT